jgi:hypothetical protein
MLLGELLRSCGWPDGETAELAQAAAALLDTGLERDPGLDRSGVYPARPLSERSSPRTPGPGQVASPAARPLGEERDQ